MKVLAYDPVAEPPGGRPLRHAGGAAVAAATSSPCTCRSPRTPTTWSTPRLLALTQARGDPGQLRPRSLIDNDAAYQALLDGRLGGIGLDVFDPEPPQHHPLFDHPDVVLTPHLMGLSRQATAATFTAAATGVVDVLDGREPAAVANPRWEQRRRTHRAPPEGRR